MATSKINIPTAIGAIAVILWALLALLTVATAPVPPFLLNTVTFAIGGVVGIIWITLTGKLSQLKTVSFKVYAFGTIGLFGYHALYFSALRLAPPAQAGLIAYLWPLLIVLFSGFLPNETLKKGHYLGGVLGFIGTGLLINTTPGEFDFGAIPGFVLAFAAAVTWAGYSVLSRQISDIPTATVAVFCIGTAILSGVLHLAIEDTIWPENPIGWLSLAALGFGPVGLAFYVWDIGVKHGDIQLLGVFSYAAPLLSTMLLVITGVAPMSWPLGIAALLITGGAALAARASFGN